MKKTLLLISCLLMGGIVSADQIYYIDADSTTPTFMQTLEEKTQDAAVKTGEAVKSGAIKAGKATKKGAIKAGKATKKGAIKATNWSAKKVRNGAEKVIIKTEENPDITKSKSVQTQTVVETTTVTTEKVREVDKE